MTADADSVLPNSVRFMQEDDQICELDDAYQSLPLPKLVLDNIASTKKDEFAMAKFDIYNGQNGSF